MNYTKILIGSAVIMTGMLLFSCSSKQHISKNDYIHNGINFGSNKNANYKQGIEDGCLTASGSYTKNSNSFNNNQSYKIGWTDGRLKCGQRASKQ